MVNYVYGEKLYREFVKFREQFLANAVERAQHLDTASDGRAVRPVVVLPFKETDRIQAEIDKWTAMANELEQYPDLNVPKTILYPIPNILRGVRKATTYQTEAINSVNMTAKRIIHLLDKDIRIQTTSDTSDWGKKYISNLEKTKKLFEQFPDDEKFRMRIHGFSETMLRVHYISTSPNFNGGKSVPYHVPLCGVFICDETLRDGLSIGPEFEKEKFSLYDSLEPIICDRWPQAKSYRMKDIEDVKGKRAQLRENKKAQSAASTTRTRKTKSGNSVNENPESAK
ncbi:phage repressor protein C1 [Klebsiella pneumoniae]|uniref:phage repressor protein C1 n=2 Tax=Klebsiella pneumoniae TaxID=573 RepID=UPI0025A0C7CA|nr:phage repressor protein C1 [Klebsiella pneumoniae]MDM7311676.1 phage repressor protein C1 [Klebsiella pneumoniae]